MCSFCKKSQTDVKYLIKGDGVCICDECVQTCVDLIFAEVRKEDKKRINEKSQA